MKDRTKFEHRHNTVYFSRCTDEIHNETYVVETYRKIEESIMIIIKGEKVHIY